MLDAVSTGLHPFVVVGLKFNPTHTRRQSFCLLAKAQESSNLVDVRYELLGFASIIQVLLPEPGNKYFLFNANPVEQHRDRDQYNDEAVKTTKNHRDREAEKNLT